MKLKLLMIGLFAFHSSVFALSIQDLKTTTVSQFDFGLYIIKDEYEKLFNSFYSEYHLALSKDGTFVFQVVPTATKNENECNKIYKKIARFMGNNGDISRTDSAGNNIYYKNWGGYFVLSDNITMEHQVELGKVASKGAKIRVFGCSKGEVMMDEAYK